MTAHICGYQGCQHLITNGCGRRQCPKNTAAKSAKTKTTSRPSPRTAPLRAAAAAVAANPLKPTTTSELWHSESGNLSRKHRGPYRFDAYVPARLADTDLTFTGELAARVERAANAIRDLNQTATADHESIAVPLLRAESVASSRIENLRISHLGVAEALESPAQAKGVAKEVANNVIAMRNAIEAAQDGPLTRDTIRGTHRTLLAGTRDEHFAGIERDEQNWIGGQSPRDAIYVPPPPRYLDALLDDLVGFAARDDLPVVAHAALLHAQFEGIHPFADGNGRTGRCLVHAQLRRSGIADRLVPPISTVLLTNRDSYYADLAAWQQDGDPQPIIGSFADAAVVAAAHAQELAARLAELRDEWIERAGSPRSDSITRRVAAILPAHPIILNQTVADVLGVDQRVARRGITDLENAGVLRVLHEDRARDRVWVADDVFDALDEFEATVARDIGGGKKRGPTRHLRK